jgi:hypothetical protein
LVLGSGTAVPTPEGPRPLFGHAWVLAGQWREFVDSYWEEEEKAVLTAIERGIPLLLLGPEQGWSMVVYSALDYTTADPHNRTVDHQVIERRWIGADGTTSRMLQFVDKEQLFDTATCGRLSQVAGDAVVVTAFSSRLRQLYQVAPNALHRLGRVTAVLNLSVCHRNPAPRSAPENAQVITIRPGG